MRNHSTLRPMSRRDPAKPHQRHNRKPHHLLRVCSIVACIGIGCGTSSPEEPWPSSEALGDQPEKAQPEVVSGTPDEVRRQEIPPDGYNLSVKPGKEANGRLKVNVTTDIPGVIELMAGLSLKGQKPEDVFIGRTERLRLEGGNAIVEFATNELPTGAYDVEATFYPNWGFKDQRSRSTGISDEIRTSKEIHLVGSGEGAKTAQFREDSQKWVMNELYAGVEWNLRNLRTG